MANSPHRDPLLSWLETGVSVNGFWSSDSRPVPIRFTPHSVDPNMKGLMVRQLKDDLRSGSVCRLSSPASMLCSFPVGLEPLKPRRICDCCYLNGFQTPPVFSLPNVLEVIRWARGTLSVLDFKAAYSNIPLHADSQMFFCFQDRIDLDLEWFYCTTLVSVGIVHHMYASYFPRPWYCLFGPTAYHPMCSWMIT